MRNPCFPAIWASVGRCGAEISVARRSAAGEAGTLKNCEILHPIKGARRMAVKS